MYNQILVAIDGSEHSRKALRHAIELAQRLGSKITLIYVYSAVVPFAPVGDAFSAPTVTTPVSSTIATRITEDAKKLGAKILDEAEQTVKENNVIVEKLLMEGDTVKEIVAEAAKGGYDLIVLGHRGMSKISEILLGSVSEGVSHKARCPVLIVK
ncbi:MAG TPA: universal stress protein [Candidatus Bathyarchaeia archaeon]|nr:universal stress protein [Candidatus Bathyarchaeia archaeon]